MALQDTAQEQIVTILITLGALVGALIWYVSEIPYYETIPAGASVGFIVGIGLYRVLNLQSDVFA